MISMQIKTGSCGNLVQHRLCVLGCFFSGCLDSKKVSEKPGIRKQTKVETFEIIIMILGIFE